MIALVSVALGWQTGSAWQWQPERIEEPFDLNLDSFGTLAPAADVEAAFTDALRVWSIEAEADVFVDSGVEE